MISSVSKYIPLERLEQIKQDNCIGASGQEYCEIELDEMILARRIARGEKALQSWLEEEADRYALEQIGDDGFVDPSFFFSEKPAFELHGKYLRVSKAYMATFWKSDVWVMTDHGLMKGEVFCRRQAFGKDVYAFGDVEGLEGKDYEAACKRAEEIGEFKYLQRLGV